MGTLASYMAQSALVMTMLYLAYKWLMASTTFLSLNRAALLGIYIVSWSLPALLPLLEIGSDETAAISVSLRALSLAPEAAPASPSTDWWRVALWIYMAGGAATLGVTVAGIMRMRRIILSGTRSEENGYVKIVSRAAPGPFSWGRYIVLRPCDCDSSMVMVMAHEEAHLRQLHWLDLVAAQITVILQWFSPAAWLMMRELKTVHEFPADRAVAGDDPVAYQMMLLKKTVGSSFPTFTDSLNHSQIKLRITMMMTKRTSPSRKMTALALPAMAALAAMTLSQPAVADVVLRIGRTSVTNGENHSRKVTKSAPSAQIPLAYEYAGETVTEEAYGADTPAQTPAETLAMNASADNENTVEEVNSTSGKPAIFVNGVLFSGDLSGISLASIVKMDILKNDPAYPDGKLMITTTDAADGEVKDRAQAATEQCASFKGGENAFRQFLMENVKYPADAPNDGKQRRVIVQFTVETDGSVSDVKIMRGQDPALDKEALRVVKNSSGLWIPGSNNGTPVASRFTIPITFSKK